MRHEVSKEKDNISLAYPHLVFDNFNAKTGERIKEVLRNLFPIPLNDKSRRTISFFARDDFISLRHHIYEKNEHNKVSLYEVGPRFEL